MGLVQMGLEAIKMFVRMHKGPLFFLMLQSPAAQ